MRMSLQAPAGAIVLTDREEGNLCHLAQAILLRVDPAVIGFVCRRGGPKAGEDWVEASRVLASVKRPFGLLPKLMDAVGEAAPALVIYHWQLVAAPSAAEVLEGRRTVDPASPSILGEAAALAYAFADRALIGRESRTSAFEIFERVVKRNMPLRARALACHVASTLIAIEEPLDELDGREVGEGKLRAGLSNFGAARAAA